MCVSEYSHEMKGSAWVHSWFGNDFMSSDQHHMRMKCFPLKENLCGLIADLTLKIMTSVVFFYSHKY